MTNKHGGARPGAGRPAVIEKSKVRNVRFPAELEEEITSIGRGNFSAGVRRAIETYLRLDAWAIERWALEADAFIEEILEVGIKTEK